MSTPSINIYPDCKLKILNNANPIELFPAPVLPITPTFSPYFIDMHKSLITSFFLSYDKLTFLNSISPFVKYYFAS